MTCLRSVVQPQMTQCAFFKLLACSSLQSVSTVWTDTQMPSLAHSHFALLTLSPHVIHDQARQIREGFKPGQNFGTAGCS